jgi:hypothetical protein
MMVNGKEFRGSSISAPPGLLDYQERKALALFVKRDTKIQSSIITL